MLQSVSSVLECARGDAREAPARRRGCSRRACGGLSNILTCTVSGDELSAQLRCMCRGVHAHDVGVSTKKVDNKGLRPRWRWSRRRRARATRDAGGDRTET